MTAADRERIVRQTYESGRLCRGKRCDQMLLLPRFTAHGTRYEQRHCMLAPGREAACLGVRREVGR